MATGVPRMSIGNRTTRNEKHAARNVPPNTVTAPKKTIRKELEMKAARMVKGRHPSTIKMARNRETSVRL